MIHHANGEPTKKVHAECACTGAVHDSEQESLTA